MSDRNQLWTRGRLNVVWAAVGVTAVACCLALPAGASASPAGASVPAVRAPAVHTAATGAVSPTPVNGTPELVATGTTVETVRQLVQCGTTMYAVGSFTQIKGSNGTFTRNNIFSFSATAPFAVSSWNPNVNGEVNSIALNSSCSDAYIGGQFTSVGGTAAANIAEVSTATGAVVSGFGHNTGGGHVDTVLLVNGHLLVGGTFTGINGSSANPYMASLSPTTGKDDGFVHLNISGHYVFPGVFTNSTEVYNQQLSHGGTLDLVMGDFTSVGGQNRQQIFMLNVGGSTATVTGWSSPEFDGSKGNLPGGYPYQCADSHPVYIRAAAWSPDDKTVYIADTGVHPWNWNGKFPIPGLCDAAAAFPATQQEVLHEWVILTGCDSLYSVAADSFAVYVGGHQRWMPNANACNAQGPGSIPDQGLAGLALGGTLLTNSTGTAGKYSRSRGHGADDMLLTSAGLWIASDNFGGNTSCGGVHGFSGICFLPYG